MRTRRLTLSELEGADAPFVLELLLSPGFIDNVGDRGVRDLAGAESYIERARASYADHGFGLWRCDLTAGGVPIGICGLVKRAGLDAPDIGYALLERFWGQGYATEAAGACLRRAREALGIATIVGFTAPTNAASIGVLTKIGLAEAGLIRLPGAAEEVRLFRTAG